MHSCIFASYTPLYPVLDSRRAPNRYADRDVARERPRARRLRLRPVLQEHAHRFNQRGAVRRISLRDARRRIPSGTYIRTYISRYICMYVVYVYICVCMCVHIYIHSYI